MKTRTEKTLPAADDEAPGVLVVEDDAGLCELLFDELSEAGFRVQATRNAEDGLSALESFEPDLVVSDIRLPGMDGLDFLERAKAGPTPPAIVLITAFGTVSQAVAALKAGADDFLTKPLDLDHLILSVGRVLERRRLEAEVAGFRALFDDGSFHGILGSSPVMRPLIEQIRRVAAGAGPVLVAGESGTGKELVARAVHAESPRAEGPYLVVNCAGIPPQLLESEFFGHAAGAFTGAERSRRGLFAEAEGGTLLLDEIGEMPLEVQAKLLRVLQEGKVRPVGANRERRVDLRIIAATNRDLEVEMREGRFREDLFYRLETFTLRVPPLREREDDVELLAGRFLHQFRVAQDKDVRTIAPDALQRLRRYPFPGNVRELRNAIERAVTFCAGRVLTLADLPARLQGYRPDAIAGPSGGLRMAAPGQPAGDGDAGRGVDPAVHALAASLLDGDVLPTLSEVDDRYIRFVLERVDGNKRRAAALLGIGRRTLYRHLDRR